MANSYLTAETLIESVVRRAHLPISQLTFTKDDILAFANEETTIGLVPSIMKMHEEFYVYPFQIHLESEQAYYEIPDRAMGQKVRSLFYQDGGFNLQEMSRILPENLAYYQNRSSINWPRAFYLENNFIVLVPVVSINPQGSLICKVFLRPNQLVLNTQMSIVQSINTSTGDVVVNQIPKGFTVTSEYDFVEIDHGHRTKGLNVIPNSINVGSKTINFTPSAPTPPPFNNIPVNLNTLPIDLNVGDMICLAGQTNVIQVPDELHSMLAQRVVCKCLEAQKDSEGLQNAKATLQEMEVNLGNLIDNRTEGQPQKVNNIRSALRAGKFRRRRSTY
jgi:hypothetical protein